MKLRLISFVLALSAPLGVFADYFSEGWKPGDAAERYQPTAAHAPGAVPTHAQPASSDAPVQGQEDYSWMDKMMASGPVSGLFTRFGVNITERIADAKLAKANMWDHRIPLVDDNNWEDLLVNEQFTTEQEEAERVWFLIVTTAMGQTESVSKFVDKQFDDAYNISVINATLPNVRWGRIDYLNTTYLTTKWGVWQAPFLIVATDRAQTLRFYKARQIRMDPEMIVRFLELEAWRETPPWRSSFAPGGSNEQLMHYFALGQQKLYEFTVRVPKWAMIMITGAVGSFALQLFHRGDDTKQKEAALRRARQQAAEAKKAAEEEKAAEPAPVAKSTAIAQGNAKKKGGKK